MTTQKVLIIKLGYSEILDRESDSRKVSLGDVLRTTPILHAYKNDDVTWLTDKDAFPLLDGNPYIKRILPYDLTTVLQLESEEFDTVVNLEKIPGICAFADKIKAWKKHGFRFDTRTGKAEAYDRAFDVLAVSSDPVLKKENQKTVQELMFELIGGKWNGEEYVLGYKPKSEEKFDIGFNTKIGQKWPTKAWSVKSWDELEKLLSDKGYTITRQEQNKEALENLYSYMDWINSCGMLVSNDSLGMHLAIALKKKVVGLFGPTPYLEVNFYGRGKAVVPKIAPDCMPCFNPKCSKDHGACIDFITPKMVLDEIQKLYPRK